MLPAVVGNAAYSLTQRDRFGNLGGRSGLRHFGVEVAVDF
jgi:hypothetical protein